MSGEARRKAAMQLGFILKDVGEVTIKLMSICRNELWHSEMRMLVSTIESRLIRVMRLVDDMMKEGKEEKDDDPCEGATCADCDRWNDCPVRD